VLLRVAEPIEDLKQVVQKSETEDIDCNDLDVMRARNTMTANRSDSSIIEVRHVYHHAARRAVIRQQDSGQPADMEDRPAKRPRSFLDAVEVPTVESIYGKRVKRDASIEEINAKIKTFKNVSSPDQGFCSMLIMPTQPW